MFELYRVLPEGGLHFSNMISMTFSLKLWSHTFWWNHVILCLFFKHVLGVFHGWFELDFDFIFSNFEKAFHIKGVSNKHVVRFADLLIIDVYDRNGINSWKIGSISCLVLSAWIEKNLIVIFLNGEGPIPSYKRQWYLSILKFWSEKSEIQSIYKVLAETEISNNLFANLYNLERESHDPKVLAPRWTLPNMSNFRTRPICILDHWNGSKNRKSKHQHGVNPNRFLLEFPSQESGKGDLLLVFTYTITDFF